MGLLQNMRDVFKTMKHRKPCQKYCPKCGSPGLHLSSSFDYWLMPKRYVCESCGYIGPIYMELEKEES